MRIHQRGIVTHALTATRLALCVASLGLPSAAHALVLQISSAAFVRHDSDPATLNDNVNKGILANAEGRYYAPVQFPRGGQVCSFSLVFRDNSDVNITAGLRAKLYVLGGNAFRDAQNMSTLRSQGAEDGVRILTDNTIDHPTIRPDEKFYYVTLNYPDDTLEALGVKIDVRSTCPEP